MQTNPSPLIQFYRNDGIPYLIDEIIHDWSDKQWEECHDFIQWIFPTITKSKCNTNAPIITMDDVKVLRSQYNHIVTNAVLRFADFIDSTNPFANNNYENPYNHNYLRISRLLEFLILYGSIKYAEGFKTSILMKYYVPEKTKQIWEDIFKNTQKL